MKEPKKPKPRKTAHSSVRTDRFVWKATDIKILVPVKPVDISPDQQAAEKPHRKDDE